MAPYYAHVVAELGIKKDAKLAASLADKNAAKLKKLEEVLADAVENLGETEQSDALIAKANYLSQIGSKVLQNSHQDEAVTAFDVAFEKTAPLGHRIDILFSVIRVGFFYHDNTLIHTYIEKVKGYTLI